MIRKYQDLTKLEMESVDKKKTIVLIPLGALEQHGNQAPLGTDFLIAGAMPEYIERELYKKDKDFPMLIFPPMPVGLSTEHMNFCGSVSFRPDTYYHLLYDIGASLAHHGFKKLAFLVCHGGNTPIVQVLSRELRRDFGVYAFILSSGAFDHPDVKATVSPGNIWDFHGGEMETSILEYGMPEAVRKDKISSRSDNPVELLDYYTGWLSADLSPDNGAMGMPSRATAEKGRAIVQYMGDKICSYLVEIQNR